jgi:hypothetical protein
MKLKCWHDICHHMTKNLESSCYLERKKLCVPSQAILVPSKTPNPTASLGKPGWRRRGLMGEYAAVKTSVWWDIENCHVPRCCDPHLIAQKMSSALAAAGYTGPITISAYGDPNCVPKHVQHALSSTGIALNHVPAGTDSPAVPCSPPTHPSIVP